MYRRTCEANVAQDGLSSGRLCLLLDSPDKHPLGRLIFHLGYLLPKGQAAKQRPRLAGRRWNDRRQRLVRSLGYEVFPYYGARVGYLSCVCMYCVEEGCFQTSSRNSTPAQETKLLPEADKTRRVTGCTRGSQEQQVLQPPFEFGNGCWAAGLPGPLGRPYHKYGIPWAQGSVIACMELGMVGDRRASRPASQSLRTKVVGQWLFVGGERPVRDRARQGKGNKAALGRM